MGLAIHRPDLAEAFELVEAFLEGDLGSCLDQIDPAAAEAAKDRTAAGTTF